MSDKNFVGDYGVPVVFTTDVDLTGAGAVSLAVKKPDGTESSWVGAVGIDTSTVEYTTIDGDLDQEGTYKVQAVIENLNGFYGRSETDSFRIYDKFK